MFCIVSFLTHSLYAKSVKICKRVNTEVFSEEYVAKLSDEEVDAAELVLRNS